MTALSSAARKRRRLRRIRITGWTALSSLLTTIIGFLAWAHVVYPPDRAATIEVYRSQTVSVEERGRAIIITPVTDATALSDTVLVFYPGARVDPYSYLPPLAHTAHATGLRVVIPHVALNLAVTDTRDIGELALLAGDYRSIATGGHSLGGVRGCAQATNPQVDHLVLFASYCANDLTARNDLRVITVLGSLDGLTDVDQVTQAASLLPGTPRTITIPGANHASFGAYGPQSGDGPPGISSSHMAEKLTDILADFLTR